LVSPLPPNQGSLPLAPRQRAEVGSILLDLTKLTTDIAEECSKTKPRRGSVGDQLASQARPKWAWSAPNALENVQDDSLMSLVSAMDHAAALAAALRSSQNISFAIATLVRGCLEALSRPRYFLTGADANEMCWRHAVTTIRDLDALPRDGVLHFTHTVPQTVAERREHILDEATRARPGISPVKKIHSYSALVKQLVTAAGPYDGAAFYTHLSGIAHAEPFHLQNFMLKPDDFDPSVERWSYRIAVPRDRAMNYLITICRTTVLVVEDVLKYWGATSAQQDRWAAGKARIERRINAFFVNPRTV
jgi:hypothetical protein